MTAAAAPKTGIGVLRWLILRRLVTPGSLWALAALQVMRVLMEVGAMVSAMPIIQYLQAEGRVDDLVAEHWYWADAQEVANVVGLSVSLPLLAALMFVSLGLREVFIYAALIRTQRIKEVAGVRLSQDLLRSSLLSQAQHIRVVGAGRFVPLISQHARSVASTLINLMTIATAYFTLAVYAAIFLVVAPQMVLILAVLGPVGWLLTRRLYSMAKDASRRAASEATELSRVAGELYRSWRFLKLSRSLDPWVDQIGRQALTIAGAQMRAIRAAGLIPLVTTPFMVGLSLVALVVAVDVLALSLAAVVIWFMAALRGVPLVQTLNRARHSFATLHGPMMEIHRELEAAAAAREVDEGTETFPGLARAISFRDVHFAYPGETGSVLTSISADVPAGRITAVVGPSGAGKSTLIDMVPRLITPDRGQVLADGVPLNGFTLNSLRGRISYLPQAPYLLDDSIARNVAMGRADADDRAVEDACRLANCLEFVTALPQGLETQLGEAGDRLSGGQRQRIALARAFLAAPDILILDEPTTGLDPDSEAAIFSALERFRDQRRATILLVTHQASLVRFADHVLCLAGGRLVESGAPEALAGGEGWAARFFAGGVVPGERLDAQTAIAQTNGAPVR